MDARNMRWASPVVYLHTEKTQTDGKNVVAKSLFYFVIIFTIGERENLSSFKVRYDKGSLRTTDGTQQVRTSSQ